MEALTHPAALEPCASPATCLACGRNGWLVARIFYLLGLLGGAPG